MTASRSSGKASATAVLTEPKLSLSNPAGRSPRIESTFHASYTFSWSGPEKPSDGKIGPESARRYALSTPGMPERRK